MQNKTAVILAGGKNSRMNYKNKSFLKINNQSFLEKILGELSDFNEKIIVSNEPELYNIPGVKVIPDIIPGHGPLSGIHTGLKHAKFTHSLFVACDMPFLKKDLLNFLVSLSEGYDVVVPKIGTYLQPLCAVYSKNCLSPIENCIKNNIHKIIAFYPEVKVRYVEEELKKFGNLDTIFKNINTPEDYQMHCK